MSSMQETSNSTYYLALHVVYIRVNCTVRVHRTAEHSKQHRAAMLQQSVHIISMQSVQCTTNKIVRLYKSQTKSATQCERERA